MSDSDIAIIAMVGRFPGAADVDELWTNLREGRSAIRRLSEAELDALGVTAAQRGDPHYVPAAAPLERPGDFDAGFFGYSPREAELLDPQQRLFLEAAWEALESAGYAPLGTEGPVGVFAGATTSNYLLLNLASHPERLGPGALQAFVSNTGDSLATRVSYKLDLRGPSFAVQSACSTSLLAVHLACQSLASEECDLALAGGVSLNLAQQAGYVAVDGSILSTDGVCRPFDAAANGTVFGSGLGVVVLKRLSDARRDADPIRAVIRGTAVSNDGHLKAGFTAPSVEGQAAAIAEALAVSGLTADQIGYVEAHGTGTGLGDPIEVEALTRAFRATTPKQRFCGLGSIKGAIGHLDVASGIAGLIKTVLALEHRELPPSVGFTTANPRIAFAQSPVRVVEKLEPWPSTGQPRRAGVSAFGFGGTNVHAVLEEAPAPAPRHPSPGEHLLVVSARSPSALDEVTRRLADHLGRHSELRLADVAHTLQRGRHHFSHRRFVLARTIEEARGALLDGEATRVESGPPAVAFVFPGQGSQHAAMGAELYRQSPRFKEELDRCASLLEPHLGFSLLRVLLADPASPDAARLRETAIAQPALFAVEYALARHWQALGVEPTAMLGHSAGEYVAACLAGVFALPDALALIAARGRLMQAQPRGAMLAIGLAEPALQPHLERFPDVELAALNEAAQCVVSGPALAIDALGAHLAQQGLAATRLSTSHAFHSRAMEPMLEEFASLVAAAKPRPPRRRFVSTLTGTWILPEQAVSPSYWAQHLRQPVRFAAGLLTLLAERPVVLEVGPGHALSGMARRAGARLAVPTLGRPSEHGEGRATLEALGRLWLSGVEPAWAALHADDPPRRVPLPTYPFERQRYWLAPRGASVPAAPELAAEATPRPEPLHHRPEGLLHRTGPRDQLEREVAEVWAALLGLADLSVDEHFFSVGGDSLLATQLVSQLRARFGVELSLQAVLGAPTISALALLVLTTLADEAPPHLLSQYLEEARRLPAAPEIPPAPSAP